MDHRDSADKTSTRETITKQAITEPTIDRDMKKSADQQSVVDELQRSGRPARFFAWLGNHFFAVTLVLTAGLLIWAIGFANR
ncbi:MAG: hypothetical protein JKY89_06850 [Immundisolibacteraceae bacterium]|nr:hypothetical protein [Immundisolibacteraceae bacterium]